GAAVAGLRATAAATVNRTRARRARPRGQSFHRSGGISRSAGPPLRSEPRARASASLPVPLDGPADRFPRGMTALHELCVEAEIPQLDGGLASDVEAVGTEHDHGVRLRQLAGPLRHTLRIAPDGTLHDFLRPRNACARTGVD